MASFGSDLILARLQQLHPKRIDLTLERIERLLERLGHPEDRLPPVVHIAGTNGKGSTLAMLHAMLEAAGRRVHRYISPHLVRFNERILLDGRPVDEPRLAEALDRCERVNAGEPITFFEITTAAAFLAFAEDPADILLLETGLGGRLDATNLVDRPLLTLISPVSMDHEAFLGDRLEAIAAEKAGILKPGVTCIVGPQAADALPPIEGRAAELGAPLLVHGRDWEVRPHGTGIRVETGGETLDLPPPCLAGVHQIENAGLAVMAALHLGPLALGRDAIAAGLERAWWPARLQPLTRGPLVDRLGGRHRLWLDGGHNPAAAEMIARSLPAIACGRPVHLVVGMLQTKDAARFMAPLLPVVRSITAVPVPDEPASRSADEIAAIASSLGRPAETAPSIVEAIEGLAGRVESGAVILIAGSLYLAGHVLRENG
jgi:dihydrofolate synthase / folylpolyglutamate synthase